MPVVSSVDQPSSATESSLGRLAALRIAVISFFRGLPLFFASRPGTPLRVLCLMAFDTVHVLRTSRRLSANQLQELAVLLDFGACANDFYDRKPFSYREYRSTRRLLKQSRKDQIVHAYRAHLRQLERERPACGGDDRMHARGQDYRESVVRLSLGMLTATALGAETVEAGIQATRQAADLDLLFRIVMLCQIIDDVLDYPQDAEAGLPGFLTSPSSVDRALKLTTVAATSYASRRELSVTPALFPFRLALLGIAALTQAAILYGYGRLILHAACRCFVPVTEKSVSGNARS